MNWRNSLKEVTALDQDNHGDIDNIDRRLYGTVCATTSANADMARTNDRARSRRPMISTLTGGYGRSAGIRKRSRGGIRVADGLYSREELYGEPPKP